MQLSHVVIFQRVFSVRVFILAQVFVLVFVRVLVLAFVFVYNATPDAAVMYGQYLADRFEFKEWFLSMNQGVGLLGSVLGCELYARYVARLNQFRFTMFSTQLTADLA